MTRPMTRAALALVLALAACGVPEPPNPPGGRGSGDGGSGDTSDRVEPCITCLLIECTDVDDLEVAWSESECAEAAEERGCEDYTFEDDC